MTPTALAVHIDAAAEDSFVDTAQPVAVARNRLRQRLVWGVVDQAVSSLTNLALLVLVARTVGVAELGAFGVAFAIYAVGLAAVRACVGEPYAMTQPATTSDAVRPAAAAAVAVGLATGVVVLATASLVDGVLRSALLPLGAFLPGLVLQDCWRYVLTAQGRAKAAVANDLVWSGVLVAGAGVLVTRHAATLGSLVSCWGIAATVAAVVGFVQLGFRPSLRQPFAWWRDYASVWPGLLLEHLALVGGAHLSLVLVGVVAELEAVGALRGATTALGPVNLLYLAAPMVLIPELARLRERNAEAVWRSARITAVSLGAIALSAGIVWVLVPAPVGEAVLGESWEPARGVILPEAVYYASVGVGLAAVVGLRALAETNRSLRVRLALSPALMGAAVVGAWVAGARGAALAMAAAGWFAVLLWWRELRVALIARGLHP